MSFARPSQPKTSHTPHSRLSLHSSYQLNELFYMKQTSPISYEHGFAVPTRCVGCPSLGRIVDAALADMAPHRKKQAELMSGIGLVDVSTGTHWVFPGAHEGLPQQLAPLGIAIKTIFLAAQEDIHKLSRNCPGM